MHPYTVRRPIHADTHTAGGRVLFMQYIDVGLYISAYFYARTVCSIVKCLTHAASGPATCVSLYNLDYRASLDNVKIALS